MKAHIDVDSDPDPDSGLVHTFIGTPANVHDVTQAHALLHGQETDVFDDAGYIGVAKREPAKDSKVNWHIAMRPGKRQTLNKQTQFGQLLDQLVHAKARIWAKVKHPFRVIKCQFRYMKARYRGLAKNTAQLYVSFPVKQTI